VNLLLNRKLVAQQGVVVSLVALVLLRKDVTHNCSFINSGNSKVEVHSSVALHDGFNNIAILKPKGVKRDLCVIILTNGFEPKDR